MRYEIEWDAASFAGEGSDITSSAKPFACQLRWGSGISVARRMTGTFGPEGHLCGICDS